MAGRPLSVGLSLLSESWIRWLTTSAGCAALQSAWSRIIGCTMRTRMSVRSVSVVLVSRQLP